jgi:hypothetical protein
MPQDREVETAAQDNQACGLKMESVSNRLSQHLARDIPAGSAATACRKTARLKPLLRTTKSCGLKTESVSTDFRSLEQGIYPGGEYCDSMPNVRAAESRCSGQLSPAD